MFSTPLARVAYLHCLPNAYLRVSGATSGGRRSPRTPRSIPWYPKQVWETPTDVAETQRRVARLSTRHQAPVSPALSTRGAIGAVNPKFTPVRQGRPPFETPTAHTAHTARITDTSVRSGRLWGGEANLRKGTGPPGQPTCKTTSRREPKNPRGSAFLQRPRTRVLSSTWLRGCGLHTLLTSSEATPPSAVRAARRHHASGAPRARSAKKPDAHKALR